MLSLVEALLSCCGALRPTSAAKPSCTLCPAADAYNEVTDWKRLQRTLGDALAEYNETNAGGQGLRMDREQPFGVPCGLVCVHSQATAQPCCHAHHPVTLLLVLTRSHGSGAV